VLIEMLSKNKNVIAYIEFIKFITRISIFNLTGNKMLMKSHLPTREGSQKPSIQSPQNLWIAKRTQKSHLKINTLIKDNSYENAIKYLESKALVEAADPLDLNPTLTGKNKIAEYVYILRPLLYVALIRKFGRKSYIPFVTSLMTEMACYAVHASKPKPTTLESDELKRRKWLFLLYLMRAPFYTDYTRYSDY
jgi:peroxin-16